MDAEELRERTMALSVAVYRFIGPLVRRPETRHVAAQLLRCCTSTAANYRAACLSRSDREWPAKLGIVREESDESVFWLLFVQRTGMAGDRRAELDALVDEASQLARIFMASYRTSKKRQKNRQNGQ
jgi:four helix bundle protein